MLEFGRFQLDPDRRQLLRDGEPLAIQAKLFDTLVVLVQNNERVVEKQELLDSVWPGAYTEESTLFQTVSALRKALGDGKEEGVRHIATVPGRGYRFVAPIESRNGHGVPVGANGAAPSALDRPEPPRATSDTPGSSFAKAARWRLIAMGLLAALVLLSAGAATAWLSRPREPPRPLRKFTIQLDHAVGEAAISPNGRYIAYTRCRSAIHGFGSVWVRDLQTGATTNLFEDPVARHLFWSPDSASVAFGVAGARGPANVQKVSVEGGPPLRLCDLPGGMTGGAWSPDGESILVATAQSPGLWTAPARGGPLTLLLEPPSGRSRTGFFHPAWLPNQGSPGVVVSQGTPRGDDVRGLELMLYRTGSGREPIRLAEGFAPAWSPTGHLLYYRPDGALSALPFSAESMEPAGAPFPVADVEGVQGPTVSQDGALAYVRAERRGLEQLVWRDRSGRKLEEVGQAQFYVSKPSLAPDQLRAVAGGGDRWGEAIWIHDLTGNEAARLTFQKFWEYSPVWSPDGKEVLFRSDRSGNGDIFVRRADGSGEARKLFGTDRPEQPQDVSPDGRYLLLVSNQPETLGDLLYLERTGKGEWSEPRVFLQTKARELAPRFSPDGRFIAYVSDASGREEIYVRPFRDGEGLWQVSKNGGAQPSWNPDGSELFYVERDTLIAVSIETKPGFVMGRSQVLFKDRGLVDMYPQQTYDVSADGRRFLMVDWKTNPKFTIEIVQNWYEEFRNPKMSRQEKAE